MDLIVYLWLVYYVLGVFGCVYVTWKTSDFTVSDLIAVLIVGWIVGLVLLLLDIFDRSSEYVIFRKRGSKSKPKASMCQCCGKPEMGMSGDSMCECE